MIMTMLSHPLQLWAAWVSVIVCAATAFSCFLLVNHWPRKGMWIEKGVTFPVWFGATATALGPFFGHDMSPDGIDLLFRGGVAVFAVWLTLPRWRELPLLDRRKRRECETESGYERRKAEEEEGPLCSH